MQFAPQQEEALKAVAAWLKEGKQPVFRLFGYAGTGKTTLARYFAEHVDGDVLFAAFTARPRRFCGRAARPMPRLSIR